MRDVLEVADVLAGVQIDRDERVGVEVVAGADCAVEVGRGIADHEIDALVGEIDRRILPNAAAERLVRVAVLGQRRLLGLDVAVQVASGRVLGRPDADGVLGDRVESPEQLAVLGVVGLDEAADAVFAAVGADQDLAVDSGRGHRFAIALLRIADLLLPDDRTGLGVERDQLRVERADIDPVVVDRDAAVVRAAAEGRDRTELGLEVPDFGAGLGVERVDVAVRGGDVHHAVDDDRRRLERFLDLRLEDPGRMQAADVAAVDLGVRVEAGLLVIAVGMKEVRAVVGRVVELALRDRRHGRRLGAIMAEVCLTSCAPAVEVKAKAAAQIDPSNSDLLTTSVIGVSSLTLLTLHGGFWFVTRVVKKSATKRQFARKLLKLLNRRQLLRV